MTPEQREARRVIKAGTIRAARRLLRLVESEDERVAFMAAREVMKFIPGAEFDDGAPTAESEALAAQLVRLAAKLRGAEVIEAEAESK